MMIVVLGIAAFLIAQLVTPFLRKLAFSIGLLDVPNHRKVHVQKTPLIGGLTIVVPLLVLGMVTKVLWNTDIIIITVAGIGLLIIGVIDDKYDLKPHYKLIAEFCISFFIAINGIRIISFYGLFGVFEIPLTIQYIITILAITVAVNAFNLMDGIDGLAASIALSGFGYLLIDSFLREDQNLIFFHSICIGAIMSFLKSNLFTKKKIFLGDSGSLFLGFLLICFGILLLKDGNVENSKPKVLYVVLVFLLPFFDFIRVALARATKRISPFKADKTHLHHYLIQLGLSHKQVSMSILLINIFVLSAAAITAVYGLSQMMMVTIITLFIMYKIIGRIRDFYRWKLRVKELER